MLHFRVNFAIQPRSPSPKHFTAFLPSQNQFWLTPFFSQPSALPLPQLLSFDNHLDCLCPNSKTPLSRSAMSSNPSPINNIANSAPRCQHRFANYKQCRLPASAESPLCPHHAKLAQSLAAEADHSKFLFKSCQSFQTAQGVNHALANLFELVAKNRISPRRAAPPSSPTSAACSSALTPASITTANSTSSIQPSRSQSSRP